MSERNPTTSRKPLSAVSHKICQSNENLLARSMRQFKTDDIARDLLDRMNPAGRRSLVALMKAVQAERDLADSILSSNVAMEEALNVEAQAKWLN